MPSPQSVVVDLIRWILKSCYRPLPVWRCVQALSVAVAVAVAERAVKAHASSQQKISPRQQLYRAVPIHRNHHVLVAVAVAVVVVRMTGKSLLLPNHTDSAQN